MKNGETELETRIERLLNLMEARSLDGFLVAETKNMLYFTGFSGGSMLLVLRDGESTLFVYGVNYEAAKVETREASVELVKQEESLIKKVTDRLRTRKIRNLGFDSLAASTYLKLKESSDGVAFKDASDLVWTLRRVKDPSEISLMKKAAELTSRGMEKAAEIIEAGISEREVAAEIEYEMRKNGSDGVAFETIVSSGSNSAFPHGGCGDRVIKKGDLVVIDIGAKYRDYSSDLTRTFIIGKPSSKQFEIYETVRKAQELAVKTARAKVEAKEVDRVARDYISRAGYGEYFVHSLGHGVGLDVHEPPTLSPKSRDVLVEGNVVTIEPGIYIPGFGGVRIEDTVLILKEGVEKLTESPIQIYF